MSALQLEMGKVVPVPGPKCFLTGTGIRPEPEFFYRDRDQNFFWLGPAPKFFLNRTRTKICFCRNRDEIFFSHRDRDQKMTGPAHVYLQPKGNTSDAATYNVKNKVIENAQWYHKIHTTVIFSLVCLPRSKRTKVEHVQNRRTKTRSERSERCILAVEHVPI